MQVTAATIKASLLSNLESVLPHLFPNGKTVGHEFRIGSVNGEAGKSLAVELRGPNRGAWQDFAFGNDPAYRGDVMRLWCAARNQTFKEAFPEMKRFCGFTQAEPVRRKPKPRVTKDGIAKLTPELRKYLVETRGIPEPILKKYRVRAHKRRSEFNEHFWLEAYIDSEGEPVMIKSTGIDKRPDGSKDIWSSEPYYTLWGWWMVGDNDREIIITEGAIDAMSLYSIKPGVPVLSLPAGAGNMDWIESDWEALQRFERIYLVFDVDKPHPKTGKLAGEEGAKEAAKRLGPARCLRVPVPGGHKDINEAILSGDERFLDWQRAWLAHAYTFDPPTIGTAEDYRREALARLARQKRMREENNFIWPSIPFQFRNGECTVLSGYPHGGKSAFLYQSHAHEMWLGLKVFMVSFEIEPDSMMVEMAQNLIGRVPTEDEMNRLIDWFVGKLYFLRVQRRDKQTTLPDLLADCDYAIQRFGCTRLGIDSLHFLARKEDYEGQDNVSRQVTNLAKSRDVHVTLVCHSIVKKGEDVIPGLGMVEGSGGITKPIDNGITIWRNVKKQEKILEAEESGDEGKMAAAERLHDAILKIWKNRESGKLPMVKLWFDSAAKSFRLKRADDIYAPLREEICGPETPKDPQLF